MGLYDPSTLASKSPKQVIEMLDMHLVSEGADSWPTAAMVTHVKELWTEDSFDLNTLENSDHRDELMSWLIHRSTSDDTSHDFAYTVDRGRGWDARLDITIGLMSAAHANKLAQAEERRGASETASVTASSVASWSLHRQ